jgi:DNA-binding NarL/FixJ family response regulator
MLVEPVTEPIRIGLVEADAFNRESLSLVLNTQADLRVVMERDSPERVYASDQDLDILLFSCRYPSEVFGEGLTLDYWRMRFLSTRLVVLAQTRARAPIAALAEAGVDGYAIRSSLCTNSLVTLLRDAFAGHQSFCVAAQNILKNTKREVDLTTREMQVMRLLHECGHASRKSLAQQLGMSYHTFNVHVRNISEKLETFGENALVKRCVELGWLADSTLTSA